MTDESHDCAILLTAPGVGAVAVVRVEGPAALAHVASVFRAKSGRPLNPETMDVPIYGLIVDGDQVLDDVMIATTRIDGRVVVDVSLHGGSRIVERFLQLMDRKGAVLRDSSDVEVFACRDALDRDAERALREAGHPAAVQFIARQRQLLRRELNELDHLNDAAIVRTRIADLKDAYKRNRIRLKSALVCLCGQPNSGKSTLFNRIVGRQAAVVSPMAGTTRDWVQAEITLSGLAISLVDTAGTREGAEELEQEAIRRGKSLRQGAELNLLVVDGSCLPDEDLTPWKHEAQDSPDWLIVVNKSDLSSDPAYSKANAAGNLTLISISALTGAGMEDVEAAIVAALGANLPAERQPSFFYRRQVDIAADYLSNHPQFTVSTAHMILKELIGR